MTIDFGELRQGLVIVPARDEHASGLIALIERIFWEFEGVIFDLGEMPELRHIASSFEALDGGFWCAFRGRRLVGCVGWVPSAKGVELRKLYVAKDERHQGLGGRLARLVEETAREQGAACVELWSDTRFTEAHRFYQRRGYVRGHETRDLGDRSNTVEHYFHKEVIAQSD